MVAILLLVALSLCCTPGLGRLLRFVDLPFLWLARRPALAIAATGLVSLLISVTLALCSRIPQPHIHDEFSYLLQADTFTHGRLANPPHPLGMHFETMHVLSQPTYASKYPPAQGLVLALGQVTCGLPIVGVWLSGALASMAICWMLFAYVRPRWAALGGILTALHPLMLTWSQGYWGGAVAACGGALVLGAAGRMRAGPPWWNGAVLGLGLAILANSRPFEGFVFALIVVPPALIGSRRAQRLSLRRLVQKVALPAGIILLPAFAWMGYYNWRVTGDALRLPLMAYAEAYDVAPKFIWQTAYREPVYGHQQLRDLHVGWEWPTYEDQQTTRGFLAATTDKLDTLVQAYCPFVIFQLPWLALPWLLARSRTRDTLLQAGVFLLALLVNEVWLLPHYAAPAFGLFLVPMLNGLRILTVWRWRSRPSGRFLVRAGLLLSAVLLFGHCTDLSHLQREGWYLCRAEIEARLRAEPGQHLIFVRYGPEHDVHAEWVYNEADIDHAKVVWARSMGVQDGELLQYFRGRHLWILDADALKGGLRPLSSEAITEVSPRPGTSGIGGEGLNR